jgi:cell division protein ZapA
MAIRMGDLVEVEVELVGRKQRLASKAEDKDTLLRAVELVNSHADKIRESGRIIGSEKITIMAALNIAHELLTLKTHGVDTANIRKQISDLEHKVDDIINDQKDLFES